MNVAMNTILMRTMASASTAAKNARTVRAMIYLMTSIIAKSVIKKNTIKRNMTSQKKNPPASSVVRSSGSSIGGWYPKVRTDMIIAFVHGAVMNVATPIPKYLNTRLIMNN